MPTNGLHTAAETAAMIASGKVLLLAADETLLSQLPSGNWIAGTAAAFMTDEGGTSTAERIFVSDLSDCVESMRIKRYRNSALSRIADDYPANGFTVLILPAGSEVHTDFAKNVQGYDGVFNTPLIGWISGVDVGEIGKRQPKVFAGTPEALSDEAVAMHVAIPEDKAAVIDIVNLFTPGDGDTIYFPADGFSSSGDCVIAGKPANLARYIKDNDVDTKLPLIADYNGALVNVSIQSSDPETGQVQFYAPVFKDVPYRFAKPVRDHNQAFEALSTEVPPAYSCNCILNFLYAELKGKTTGHFTGPITFGEIAYMLLNQTLVYLQIVDAP